jgi:hypothetical protein
VADTCDRCHRPNAASAKEFNAQASRRGDAGLCWTNSDWGRTDCAAARDRWLVAEVERLRRIETRLAQYRDGLPEHLNPVSAIRGVLTVILEGRP